MDARLVEHAGGAHHLVLDMVEVHLFAEQPDEPPLPGTLQQRAQLLDRLQFRVAGEHELDRPRVVDVHQERQAFVAPHRVVLGTADGRIPFEHAAQLGAIRQKPAVVDGRCLSA
jgi:hypothetical protein